MRKIVFLHIERSAGSALRRYFNRTIGFSNIAWWGINIDHQSDPNAPQTIQGKLFCGGHAPLAVYNEYGVDPAQSLFVSILREPVERVISLYEFDCAYNPALTGSSSASAEHLLILLESSEEYRQRAFASQCVYLSGKDRANAAIDVIKNHNYLIGLHTKIEACVNEFSRLLQLNQILVTNVNSNIRGRAYLDQYLGQERLRELIVAGTEQDIALHQFVSSNESGYINTISQPVEEFFAAELKRVTGSKPLYPKLRIKDLQNKGNGRFELILEITNDMVAPILIVPINGPPGYCVRVRAKPLRRKRNVIPNPIWVPTFSTACLVSAGEQKDIVFEVNFPATLVGTVDVETILGHSGDEIFEFKECMDSTLTRVDFNVVRFCKSLIRVLFD